MCNELVSTDRKRSRPDFRKYPDTFLEGPMEMEIVISHGSQSLDRGFKPGPPAYEAGMLTIRPSRYVKLR
jgi:hypothetical protein